MSNSTMRSAQSAQTNAPASSTANQKTPAKLIQREQITVGHKLGSDRLLSAEDVSKILGFKKVTATKVMKATGAHIKIHSRVYVMESALLAYLQNQEARHAS